MYTFSAFLNAFSVEFQFCVLPAGGEGVMCYTLAERYRERIRCFTPALQVSPLRGLFLLIVIVPKEPR